MPASGSGTYRGAITGWAAGGIPIDYVADLTMDVDFRDHDVSGEITNMVTDGVAGFAHPNGGIGLYGDIVRDAEGAARIVLDGSGTLRGPGMEAGVRVDGAGAFVGADGRAMRGRARDRFHVDRRGISTTRCRTRTGCSRPWRNEPCATAPSRCPPICLNRCAGAAAMNGPHRRQRGDFAMHGKDGGGGGADGVAGCRVRGARG